jgi:hypothetical protein
MKVFISWSGTASRKVAEALSKWLGNVIQALDPWMSASDIEKGTRWGPEIAQQLAGARFGIICLTPNNLNAPWILFEAGALSKTLEERVCPYLFHIAPTELTGPLTQFQAAEAQKEGTISLLKSITDALGEDALAEPRLEEIFDVWWPRLERQLRAITLVEEGGEKGPERTEKEMIEEMLGLTRELGRDMDTLSSTVRKLEVNSLNIPHVHKTLSKRVVSLSEFEDLFENFKKMVERASQLEIGSGEDETAEEELSL